MSKISRRLLPVWAAAAAVVALAGPADAGAPSSSAPPDAAVLGSTDRLIVRLRDAALAPGLAAQQANQVAGRVGAPMRHLRGMSGRAQVMQLARAHGRAEVEALARRVAADPAVEFAEPDWRMVPLRVPTDPSYASQWDLFEAVGGINAPAAWDRTTGSSAITVAVIDTGVRPHADLAGRLVAGYDFIGDTAVSVDGDGRDADASDPGDYGCNGSGNSTWHGTHVAGTIGAAAGNGAGIAGINWVSKIQPVRVLGRCGGYTSDIADGVRWAAGLAVTGAPSNPTPARVLNLSLGGGSTCGTTFQNAINDAVARGAVVVVAAGNSGVDVSQSSPANCSGVIAVAATTRTGAKASYSNFGSGVTIAAPGSSILSTLNAGATTPGADSYAYYSGTSMATPHVAGVVSLMLSLNPALTPAQVSSMLRGSARAFPTGTGADCTTATCGAGIVDAAAALNAALPATPPPATGRTNWALTANGSVFTASSTYSAAYAPAGAGDGDRKGVNWGAGGGWNDATGGAYPDALEINFGTARTVAEIGVYTVQDNFTAPVEPTEATTFTRYGIVDFDVQYWTGAAWVTVPGGSVTGNNRVARRFTFTPVTTSRVRVVVNSALSTYSRIVEVEAWSDASKVTTTAPVNVAAAANGGVASASSTYSGAYPVAAVNDGERAGRNWGAGGGWNDATINAGPDTLQVTFAASRTINTIDVYTLQDNFSAPQTPTATMTFSQYGITAFDVQAWNGSAWATVPGGSITGNNLVWRRISFPALTASAIRVVVTGALAGYSRITEVEAWTAP